MANTLFTYLYRDASNYKEWNTVVLKGDMPSEQDLDIIQNALDNGENFIPEQIGLPLMRPGDINEDDHCWAELCGPKEDWFEPTNRKPSVSMTVQELVQKFQKIATGQETWDDITYAIP